MQISFLNIESIFGCVLYEAVSYFPQVSQKSLRQTIGVVPQDTVLFNTDIR